MANDCIPYKELGTAVTAKATAAVTGKTLVTISGDRTGGGGGGAEGSSTVGVGLSTDLENLYQVKVCGAGVKAFAVAGYDAAINAELKVFVAGHGIILPVTAAEALTAGWEVESNAEGKLVKLAAGKPVGLVLNKAASGKDAEILFY